MRNILVVLSLSLFASSGWAQLFSTNSQQSYGLNIPDTSIASPPCQVAAAKTKKAKKTDPAAAGSTCVTADLKKGPKATEKAETAQQAPRESVTP
jgi:hypothetical protein